MSLPTSYGFYIRLDLPRRLRGHALYAREALCLYRITPCQVKDAGDSIISYDQVGTRIIQKAGVTVRAHTNRPPRVTAKPTKPCWAQLLFQNCQIEFESSQAPPITDLMLGPEITRLGQAKRLCLLHQLNPAAALLPDASVASSSTGAPFCAPCCQGRWFYMALVCSMSFNAVWLATRRRRHGRSLSSRRRSLTSSPPCRVITHSVLVCYYV